MYGLKMPIHAPKLGFWGIFTHEMESNLMRP